ncbi:hypothetical protein D3C79_663830 [compost metagenome]
MVRRPQWVGHGVVTDFIRADFTGLLTPVVVLELAGQFQLPVFMPIDFGLLCQLTQRIVRGPVDRPWRPGEQLAVVVITLFIDGPVDAIQHRTRLDVLDIEHALLGRIIIMRTEVILILPARLVTASWIDNFERDTTQGIVHVANLHIIVVAVEQGFAVEQRVQQRDGLGLVIEADDYLDRLQCNFVGGFILDHVITVGGGRGDQSPLGILARIVELAHLQAPMQECIVRVIEI